MPRAYGPRTTLYNRYNRWARQGVWRYVFEHVTQAGAMPDELAIDATHIKAHRSAGGGKRGKQRRRSAARAAAARRRSTRWLMLAAVRSPHPDARQHGRHRRRTGDPRHRPTAAPAAG